MRSVLDSFLLHSKGPSWPSGIVGCEYPKRQRTESHPGKTRMWSRRPEWTWAQQSLQNVSVKGKGKEQFRLRDSIPGHGKPEFQKKDQKDSWKNHGIASLSELQKRALLPATTWGLLLIFQGHDAAGKTAPSGQSCVRRETRQVGRCNHFKAPRTNELKSRISLRTSQGVLPERGRNRPFQIVLITRETSDARGFIPEILKAEKKSTLSS